MPQPAADRNLLFGILAVQMDFITREQLFNAMQAWVFDKSKSLGEILRAQHSLDDENQSLLEKLVQKHLAKHGNDAEKSLAAVATPGNLRRDLERIADADVQTSLGHVSLAGKGDPYATVMPTPSQAAAAGVSSRFQILRPHARGGLGEVFVARDEELHREVALKEIQNQAADNQESRARFMLEAEITGGLEHPGIVPVYGLGTYPDGRPYYAMRFIRGDSLKEAIDRYHKNIGKMSAGARSLELRGLLGRLVDVCNAIAYAHSRDVLHRDLKPGNIMLGKYGETLVVDWGLAKPLGGHPHEKVAKYVEPGEGSLVPSSMTSASATLVGSAIGTPQYMSPEQAAGQLDKLGPASDVYSLGATLYCILAGVPPVGGNDVGDMLRRVQRGDFQKPSQVVSGVPAPLEAICLKAMSLQAADRYPSPRELADDIEHWLADEPVIAYPEPWTVRARRWIHRNMTLVTGIASAIVVALIGLIVTTILLTAANERERLAKQKAEENFQLAKQAVDDYHTKVSEDVLLQEPGMQPLRKKLLESASAYYAKFVNDRAEDPGLRGESGRAQFRLAQITGDIGSRPESIEKLQKAAAVFESLPANQGYQADLAATYHHLGRLYRTTDKLKESDEYYEKANKLWQSLADAKPNDVALQAGLARTLMGVGNNHQDTSQPGKARAAWEKSLKAWETIAKSGPARPEYQREIAINQFNLGILYQDQAGKEIETIKLLRDALAIQKKLVEDAPNVSKYQNDLAATNYVLAKSLGASYDTRGESRKHFREAAERWQKLVDVHPAVVEYQTRLADAYFDLASALRVEQDWAEAETIGRKAVEVQRKLSDTHKDDGKHLGNLANGLSALAFICGNNRKEDRSREAEEAFTEALGIQEPRAASQATPYNVRDLARTLNRLGMYQVSRQREEKAADTFKRAAKHWESLTKINPASQDFAVGLSETYFGLGDLNRVAGKPKDAEPWFTKAIECFDVKNTSMLASVDVQMKLTNAYWRRAEVRTKLKNYDEGLKDWDRALEHAANEDKLAIRLPRAAALARAGKHAEAVKEADAMMVKAKSGDALFRFARVYALAATAAKDQKALSETYAQQAMKALTAAIEKGYFKSGAEQAMLHDDPDLQVLRDRPEFKKMLSEFKIQ